MVLYDDLLLENPAFQQPFVFRALKLNIPEPEGDAFRITTSDTGGAAYLSAEAEGTQDRVLLWEFAEEEPHLLRVSEVSPSSNLRGHALKLHFPSALHTQALVTTTHRGHTMILLSARGVLHALHFPHGTHVSNEESVLNNFQGENGNTVDSVPLQTWCDQLNAPTCMTEVDGAIAIGGSSGAIVCVPKSAFGTGSPTGAFELQDSKGLLGSFFSRSTTVPVQDLARLEAAHQTLFLAMYGDGTLRIWDIRLQKRVFSVSLLPEPVAKTLIPRRIRVAPPAPTGLDYRLVVQYERSSADSGSASQQVGMYKLVGKPGLGGFSLDANAVEMCNFNGYIEDIDPSNDSEEWGNWVWILGGNGKHLQLTSVIGDGDAGPEARLLGPFATPLRTRPSIQAALWEALKEAVESGASTDESARYLLEHMLVPGEISYKAMSIALGDHGKDVPVGQLKGKTKTQIIDFLVLIAQQQEGISDQLLAVQRMADSYLHAWGSLYPPYTLLKHPRSGKLSVVRAGPSLHPLRPATPSEYHLHTALVEEGGPHQERLGALPKGVVPLGDDFEEELPATDRLVEASRFLMNLFGANVLQASLRWFWTGRQYSSVVVPALLDALMGQGVLPGEGKRTAPPEGASHEEWRKRRRFASLKLQRLLSSIPDIAKAATELLKDLFEPPMLPFPGQSQSDNAQAANHAAFRASSTAVVEILQGVLVLIGYLGRLRTLGTWQVPATQLDLLQEHLSEQIEAAIRQASIVRWLTTTPTAESASSDASSLMTQLRLGGGISPQDRVRASKPEKLLASLFGLTAASSHAGTTLEGLMTGPRPGSNHVDVLLHQVLNTATILFTSQQFAALTDLLQLAATLNTSPAIKFLQGYASLGCMKHDVDDRHQVRTSREALRPFYQAAEALGPRAEYLRNTRDAESKQCLQNIVRLLQQELTGASLVESLEVEKLQYFEVLMALCEKIGFLDGAAECAQAAAHQALYLREMNEGQEQLALQTREGRIWHNLFVYALSAGKFQEAYVALEANPLAEHRLHCLQTLIRTLCESKQLSVLAALPYASLVQIQRNGRPQNVTLLHEVLRILKQRAENAELEAEPQPYEVLASFCIAKGDWRSAAAAYLAYSRRLGVEGVPSPTLSQQISVNLCASANALSFVAPEHAWLEDEQPTSEHAKATVFGSAERSALEASTSGREDRQRLQKGVVSLKDLKRETLSAILQARWIPGTRYLKPSEAVQELYSIGRYEPAVQLAEAALHGPSQAAAIRKALAGMATACALRQVGRGPQAGKRGAATDPFADFDCSWNRLEVLVRRHSKTAVGVPLWTAVAEAIMGVDRRLKLPAWLTSLFTAGRWEQGMAGGPGNPSALLRVYIQHENLLEAGTLAQEYLTTWLHEVTDLDRQRVMGAWFPYGLLRSLQEALKNSSSRELQELGAAIAQSCRDVQQLGLEQTALQESLSHCFKEDRASAMDL